MKITREQLKEILREELGLLKEVTIKTKSGHKVELDSVGSKLKIELLRNKGYDIPDTIDNIKREHTRAHIGEYVKFNELLFEQINRLYIEYKLAIASNSRSEFVFKCLNILKIWQLECVYTRDYGPSKPDPWMYNQCMRVTGSNSTNTPKLVMALYVFSISYRIILWMLDVS